MRQENEKEPNTHMEYVVFAFVAAGLVALLAAKGIYDAKSEKAQILYRFRHKYGELRKKEYGLDRYKAIAGYFKHHGNEEQIDEITFQDLSMDDIFMQMNFTNCQAGEEVLYHLLRTPDFTEEPLAHKEAIIQYFEEHKEERVQLQYRLNETGYTGKFSLYDYLDNLDILGKRSNLHHYTLLISYIPAIAFCFFSPSLGILLILGLMMYGMISYFREKGEVDVYLSSFAFILKLMETSEKIEQLAAEGIKEEQGSLRENRKALGQFRRGSFWLMSNGRMSGSGNPLDMILDYLRMSLHFDLIKFNTMLEQVRKHTENVDGLFYTIGYLDAMVAIGEYRASLQNGYCIPVLQEEKEPFLSMEEGYHPLLDNPVKNSIEAKNGILLTGSNASGKSTFLRTVAISAILAQTIHTVPARQYRAGYFRIMSAMSLSDDILSGESYYIVEIRAIKRIMDTIREKGHVLCFVDEVLRGTNTVERIAAGTEILRKLLTNHTLCFAATHDLELTELLKDSYDNYHFEEEVKDGDVHFNYRLMNGRATTRNAIKLLSAFGYDEDIIKGAGRRADEFLQTGQWK